MGIELNDPFSIEWVALYESPLYFGGLINVECYRSLFDPETAGVIVGLGGLKSRSSLRIGNGDVYLPLDSWNQVVVANVEVMQKFVLDILTSTLKLSQDDSMELTVGLTDALEDGCDIRPPNPRLN